VKRGESGVGSEGALDNGVELIGAGSTAGEVTDESQVGHELLRFDLTKSVERSRPNLLHPVAGADRKQVD
jgi:hypothetical protein